MDIIRKVVATEAGLGGEVFFTLFDSYIELTTDEHADIELVKRNASYLNTLPDPIIEGLCHASIRYCNHILRSYENREIDFETPRDILGMIWPMVLVVPKPESPDDLFFEIELECEWEPEHGMEWLIRNQEILYVGPFRGLGLWVDIYRKDPHNFA